MDQSWTHQYIDVDGINTHYIEAGSPEHETLLLIHGGGTSSCAELNYGDVVGVLARDLHVIAVDVAGFGRTTGAGPEQYSYAGQGDFLIRFMEELDLTPHVGGNSLGGWLTMYLALEAPHRGKSIVLINSRGATLTPDDRYVVWDKDQRYHRPPRRPFGIKKFTSGPPTRESVAQKLAKGFENKALVTDERVDLAIEMTKLNGEYSRARTEATSSSDDLSRNNYLHKGKYMPEYAQSLTQPVLLTWSRENPGSSPEDALGFFNQLDNAQMHVFSNARHHVMLEHPEKWSAVVRDFILTQNS